MAHRYFLANAFVGALRIVTTRDVRSLRQAASVQATLHGQDVTHVNTCTIIDTV